MKKIFFIAVLGALVFSSCETDEAMEEQEINAKYETEADEPDVSGPKGGS